MVSQPNIELPFLNVGQATDHANRIRGRANQARCEPIAFTCLAMPAGLFLGERLGGVGYMITHEIDWGDDDLPTQRNKLKWNSKREQMWIAANMSVTPVQLAFIRFMNALQRGIAHG